VLLLARVGLGIFERTERPPRPDLVEWREPGALAEAEARRTGKPVLYDFTAEWCGPCRALQDEVFSDTRWAAKINAAYVPVRVLDRRRETGRNPAAVDTLQRRYRVQAFPTLVVTSPDGTRHATLEGYRGGLNTTQWLSMASLQVMGVMPDGRSTRTGTKAR
jgi:thiol:disulfide interchange protein